MKPKNYELLNLKWEYMWPVPETIISFREQDRQFSAMPSYRAKLKRLKQKLFFPALRHLEFGPIDVADVRFQCDEGVDLAVEYFAGRWWYPEIASQLSFSEGELKAFCDVESRALDKNRRDRKLEWFDALTCGLFLGGLTGRWDDIATICSWFDATIEPEYKAGQLEDEYMQLFICIAGSLSPQPMTGMTELLAKVKKCRTKRPKLLCAAWEAANAGDQAAFDKAFKETVTHFLSKREGGQIQHWVATHQSIVWIIAERRGLKFPSLPEKLQAAIVTRQSAGLAD